MRLQNILFGVVGFSILLFLTNYQTQKPKPDPEILKIPTRDETQHFLQSRIDDVCPRRSAKIAIVVPYHLNDADMILKGIERWKKEDFFPCEDDVPPIVDLIFSNCLGSSVPNEQILEAFTPELKKCFRSIQFVYEESVTSTVHDLGSLQHLNATLFRMRETHDYFFLMEADTYPIRRNWISTIIREVMCGSDFWMKGSHPRDATNHTVYWYGWHVNGNAIYNVRFKRGFEIMQMILSSADPPIYDIIIDRFFRNPDNAELVRTIRHLYVLCDFMFNLGGREFATYQMRREHPEVVFVHSRAISDNPAMTFYVY
eukprot:TRINITY_DN6572_c0_g1_i1.p1 TRINITY_DN6572_c0_g1~~TRINITY_DN6572_c0_g1_i1.p1  ORF type:complete len:314 (+),score=60.34 TRINITY_DN6572_c0_g1_i1:58-999(+)